MHIYWEEVFHKLGAQSPLGCPFGVASSSAFVFGFEIDFTVGVEEMEAFRDKGITFMNLSMDFIKTNSAAGCNYTRIPINVISCEARVITESTNVPTLAMNAYVFNVFKSTITNISMQLGNVVRSTIQNLAIITGSGICFTGSSAYNDSSI